MRFIRLLALALALMAANVAAAPPVDVNSADAATLAEVVKGLGPAKAEAIVAYRSANGPFRSLEELTAVKGIGDKTLQSIRQQVTVGSP